jgi:hypothetical protein
LAGQGCGGWVWIAVGRRAKAPIDDLLGSLQPDDEPHGLQAAMEPLKNIV